MILCRILFVKKMHRHIKCLRQSLPQSLHAVALCGMVAGADKGHAGFVGQVILRFGNLTGHKRIHALIDGRLKKTLRTAGAPRHPADLALTVADQQRQAPTKPVGHRAIQQLPDRQTGEIRCQCQLDVLFIGAKGPGFTPFPKKSIGTCSRVWSEPLKVGSQP